VEAARAAMLMLLRQQHVQIVTLASKLHVTLSINDTAQQLAQLESKSSSSSSSSSATSTTTAATTTTTAIADTAASSSSTTVASVDTPATPVFTPHWANPNPAQPITTVASMTDASPPGGAIIDHHPIGGPPLIAAAPTGDGHCDDTCNKSHPRYVICLFSSMT
jgi:hypothetical protein